VNFFTVSGLRRLVSFVPAIRLCCSRAPRARRRPL
jgi:hypothetical protein